MKFTFMLCVLMIPIFGQSQFEHKGTTVDGSVNYKELNDTIHWKTIVREPNVIIRESDDSYYVALMSNTYTSVNLYVDDRPSMVRVFHASYSLGDATYTREGGGAWTVVDAVMDEESGKKVYTWKFRDPVLRDSSAIMNIPSEMETFYADNLWAANTMPMGSYREVEFLISKQMVTLVESISLTYLAKDSSGNSTLMYYPSSLRTITKDAHVDRELQNGYLPLINGFDFN